MKRKFLIIGLILTLLLCLIGCSKEEENKDVMSLVYLTNTGNAVSVTLDYSDSNYVLESNEDIFVIKSEDQLISQGWFVDYDNLVENREAAKLDEDATVIKETKNTTTYIYKNADGTYEYDCLLNLNDTIGVFVGSSLDETVTQEMAKDVLYRLTFNITT